MVAPFGSARKDVHLAMRESLSFDDPEHPADGREGTALDQECYALNIPGADKNPAGNIPMVFGNKAESYVLCYYHDHLARVEISLALAADTATKVFADLCSRAMKDMTPLASSADICQGRRDSEIFKASLVHDEATPMPAASGMQGQVAAQAGVTISYVDENQLPPT